MSRAGLPSQQPPIAGCIGLVAVTPAGRGHAARLAEIWPQARLLAGTPAEALRTGWPECTGFVCFLAVGATVRLIAPLLMGKDTDPGVVCVDEAGRFAVVVTGGHGGGANQLAEAVSAVLGAQSVITTATDRTGLTALDQLGRDCGLSVEPGSDVAGVTAAMLAGDPVLLAEEVVWPLPALFLSPARTGAACAIVVTDRAVVAGPGRVVLRPRSLVLGIGASRGVSAEEVLDLVDQVLAGADLCPTCVDQVATVDAKADEVGLLEAVAERGWRLVCHPAADLAKVEVPHPSAVVEAAVGTPSVAEAAALIGGGELLVAKTASARATVAVARKPTRGRLAVVSLGPGARDLLTPRARAELRRASVVVGLDQYLEQVADLFRPGTRVLASGLGAEEERARTAVAEARLGRAVALIGSGDAGIYAMASPALMECAEDLDVVCVPGVTAALAAAALLGAPLGHDHVAISLSDLHTPWEVIERRVRAAADGDFVVTFYNPRSRGRDWQLSRALELLSARRAAATPVGVVRQASRPGEAITITTLAGVEVDLVDMYSVVIVGSSQTTLRGGRMVTPRGYAWA